MTDDFLILNDGFWPHAAGADERVQIAIASAGREPQTIERTMALESVEQACAALGCGLPSPDRLINAAPARATRARVSIDGAPRGHGVRPKVRIVPLGSVPAAAVAPLKVRAIK